MATKKQMFDERLSSSYSWEEIDKMTKPEVEELYYSQHNSGEIKLVSDDQPGEEEQATNDVVNQLQKELENYKEPTEIDRPVNPQPQTKAKPKRKSKFAQKTIISGYMMLMLIDLVFPNIVVILYRKLKGDTDISARDIQLSTDQKEELQPLADEAAKTLNMEVNPMVLFLVSLGTYYAANFFALTGDFAIIKRK